MTEPFRNEMLIDWTTGAIDQGLIEAKAVEMARAKSDTGKACPHEVAYCLDRLQGIAAAMQRRWCIENGKPSGDVAVVMPSWGSSGDSFR